MANTNFAALTANEKMVWSRQFWAMARNFSFIDKFAGTGANAMVQRITELTKDERGTRAVLTLIADMTGDGVTGDYALEGNEEDLKAYDTTIRIDQLRNANVTTGRLADQKTIVNFRETSRDQLAYWIADRIDQLAFLTLAGVSYTFKNNGALRAVKATGQNLSDLEFASMVTAPSTNRWYRWDSASKSLKAGNTALITAADTLSYAALVQLKALAKVQYIRGIKGPGGEEVYHVFVTPQAMAKLKLDQDFLANVRYAGVRGESNSLFAGTSTGSVMVDGLFIHEYRHVFNNSGTATKWGAGNAIEGCRVALCGAQALGMADLGNPEWYERLFDYDNKQGITISKMFGVLKPKFTTPVTSTIEDFGVISLDVAQ